MNSHIIGKINFDLQKLQQDINQLKDEDFSKSYQEYAYGEWKVCALWNKDGCQDQATISEYNETAVQTIIGHKLQYLTSLITQYFDTSCLKFARIFSANNNGLVIPHRDYLELTKPFQRVHIPIQTNLSSLISEENSVFHMRLGEVWYLDASRVHSAVCFSYNTSRLHLVLDFDTTIPVYNMLVHNIRTKDIIPQFIDREKISDVFFQKLLDLSYLISKENFDDVVAILAKVHFKKIASAIEMFNWLKIITERSKDSYMMDQANLLYNRCIICR